MTDLDLTEAHNAVYAIIRQFPHSAESNARVWRAFDAAVPVIERQIRERIAADIEAIKVGEPRSQWAAITNATFDTAARVARGGVS